MKIPAIVARSLSNYIRSGGAESTKATMMLIALGWHADGTRATPTEVAQARRNWLDTNVQPEQDEIPF